MPVFYVENPFNSLGIYQILMILSESFGNCTLNIHTLWLLLSHLAVSFPFSWLEICVAKESLKANGVALRLGPQSTAFRILRKMKQNLIMKQIIQLNKKQQLGIARLLCENQQTLLTVLESDCYLLWKVPSGSSITTAHWELAFPQNISFLPTSIMIARWNKSLHLGKNIY